MNGLVIIVIQNQSLGNLVNNLSDQKIPIRLAFLKPDGTPNIISLWYEQINGKIYCATKSSSKIVSYLQNNPQCGFEIATDKPPYKGTRGSGIAKIIPEVAIEITPEKIFNYDYSKRMKDV
jgi:hypothetical protein